MADVCCRDMILRDRQKLLYPHWVGINPMVTSGATGAGTGPSVAWADPTGAVAPAAANRYNASSDLSTTPNSGPNMYTIPGTNSVAPVWMAHQARTSSGGWAPQSRGDSPGVGYDQFKALFAPLQGYKYDPFKMRLKFQIIRKRTYYNTTNVLQTVHHYLLSRRHRQFWGYNLTDDAKVTPAPAAWRESMGDVWTTLDVMPYRDYGRMQYNASQGSATGDYYRPRSAAVFYCDEKVDPDTAVLNVTNAGEVYKKYAHYRHMGLSTQWLRAIYMRPPGLPGLVDFFPNQVPDQTFFDQTTLSSVGQYPWDSIGYHFQQAAASDSVHGQAQQVLYNAYGPDTSTPVWTEAPNWTPLKNPFLKRLFRIHEKRMVLPPGGTQTVVHRTRSKRGGVNLWHQANIRDIRFFYGPDQSAVSPYGSKVSPTLLEWMNAVFPYRNPYAQDWKPPLLVYAAKRMNGYQTSDLWVTVRGQMSYSSDGGTPPNLRLNYAPGAVVYRERTIVKCKVVSYGRQMVTGGKSFYVNDMYSGTTPANFASTNPTFQPTGAAFTVAPTAGS